MKIPRRASSVICCAAVVLLAGCKEQAAPPPAPAPKTQAATPAPEPEMVLLPLRASNEAVERFHDRLPQKVDAFLGPKGDEVVHLERLDMQVVAGLSGAINVLESPTEFYRVIYSFRPHYAAQQTAVLVSLQDEILAVAHVRVDCSLTKPPAQCDPFENFAVYIYVPKGKATPERLKPLSDWGSKGTNPFRPVHVIELP